MLKNNIKFLNISELSSKLGLISKKSNKPLNHTIRFWETKFNQLKPTILAGGRRYYSSRDVEVAKMIFFLLKDRGMTISGAKKAMNENLKHLDGTKTSSIKASYYKKEIKIKSQKILLRIKKLNGKKNTY